MQEILEFVFFFAFFYWPFYLLIAAILLFLVFKFWRKNSIIMKILMVAGGLVGVMILLMGLYVVVMLIYGTIINLPTGT